MKKSTFVPPVFNPLSICSGMSSEQLHALLTRFNGPPKIAFLNFPQAVIETKCFVENPMAICIGDLPPNDGPYPTSQWNENVHGPKENMISLFRKMVLSHNLNNLTVIIGDDQLSCNQSVLMCYSKRFSECRNAKVVVLPKELLSARGFVLMYDWMLADRVNLQRCSLIELFRAAVCLDVEILEKQCWGCIENIKSLHEQEAFKLYEEAQAVNFDYLNTVLLNRIGKYFMTVVGTQRFLNMPLQDVVVLLSSDQIVVNSEIEVLGAAIRWLMYDYDRRQVHKIEVLSAIRFSLMPCAFISVLSDTYPCKAISEVFQSYEVEELIGPSLSYTTELVNTFMDQESIDEFLKSYGDQVPEPRQWTFDKHCSYHHHILCGNAETFTMESFTAYCAHLQKPEHKNVWKDIELVSYDGEPTYCRNRYCRSKFQKTLLPWMPVAKPEVVITKAQEIDRPVVNITLYTPIERKLDAEIKGYKGESTEMKYAMDKYSKEKLSEQELTQPEYSKKAGTAKYHTDDESSVEGQTEEPNSEDDYTMGDRTSTGSEDHSDKEECMTEEENDRTTQYESSEEEGTD